MLISLFRRASGVGRFNQRRLIYERLQFPAVYEERLSYLLIHFDMDLKFKPLILDYLPKSYYHTVFTAVKQTNNIIVKCCRFERKPGLNFGDGFIIILETISNPFGKYFTMYVCVCFARACVCVCVFVLRMCVFFVSVCVLRMCVLHECVCVFCVNVCVCVLPMCMCLRECVCVFCLRVCVCSHSTSKLLFVKRFQQP